MPENISKYLRVSEAGDAYTSWHKFVEVTWMARHKYFY